MDNRAIKHHQLFPSIQDIVNTPNIIFSDHLPIACYINDEPLLRILSWNVYREGSPCGFELPHQSYFGNQIERHKRICAALLRFVDNLNITIFALQEVSPNLLKMLQATFNDSEWKVISNEFLVTISRNILAIQTTSAHSYSQTVEFQVNKKIVNLVNAHFLTATYPDKTENKIIEKLAHPTADINIIVGVLNSCIAPTHKQEKNIITSLTPSSFAIRVNWVDGGFIQYKGSHIAQLEHHVLNPTNGKHDEAQTEELIEKHKEYFQMHICLDKKHTDAKLFGEQTMHEYEAELHENTGDNGILIRLATNAYNHKMIAIKLSHTLKMFGYEICEILQKILPNDKKIKAVELNPSTTILCVPLACGMYLKNAISIAKIIKSINAYEVTRKDKISFFAYIFDFYRGQIRASTFKSLIITYHHNPLIIDILTLAMLVNHNGTQLKMGLYTQLGYTSLDQACFALTDKISDILIKEPIKVKDDLTLFSVLEKIVYALNSKKTIESPEMQNALQLLNQIIPFQQPDKIIKC